MKYLLTLSTLIGLSLGAYGGHIYSSHSQLQKDAEETKVTAIKYGCGEYDSHSGEFHFINAVPPQISGIMLESLPTVKHKVKK